MAITTKTDAELQQDVLEELDWDPEVEATEIGVTVDDGVVTLSGTVDSYAKKVAAERATQRLAAVRAIANDLVVKGATAHTDTDIAKAVADAIEANSLIPRDRIDITVKNGKVTLAGAVDWDYQRMAAANSIRHLTGVRDVINLVTLMQPRVSAASVKAGIERALVRSAEVDAGRIQVHTVDGHVTLSGTVRSWPEKQEAAYAAWRSPGVTQVTNQIEVRPFGA